MSRCDRQRARHYARETYRRSKAPLSLPPAAVMATDYVSDIRIDNPNDTRFGQSLKVPVYRISDLARVIGRSPQSVRLWTKEGILPPPLFLQADGRRGWMYTYDQVWAIWQRVPLLAEVDEQGRENWRFARELRALWAAMPDGVVPLPSEDAQAPYVASEGVEELTPRQLKVYLLKDPRNHRIYYVGLAADPEKRKREHMDYCARAAFRGEELDDRCRWLHSLEQEGLAPVLEVVAEVPKAEGRELEEGWIHKLRQEGEPLTNKLPY